MKTETRINQTTSEQTNNPVGGLKMKTTIIRNGIVRLLGTSVLAVALAALPMTTANAVSPATIDNTATVTGDSPTGTDDVTSDSNDVEVDLEDPTNTLTIAKSASLTTDGDTDTEGDATDVITYTYTITNTGNTTLTNVLVNDTHDGDSALTTPTFSSWTNQASSPTATVGVDTAITMNPGAIAVFQTTYTITTADILAGGGTGVGLTVDNDIDNSAVAEGDRSSSGDTVSAASTAFIPLDIDTSLAVVKSAYEAGVPADIALTGLGGATAATANQPAGTTITYVYAVTNDGNVPISNVGLSDAVTNYAGTSTVTPAYNSLDDTDPTGTSVYTSGTEVDILYPGDIAYFTSTYLITQADIDNQ